MQITLDLKVLVPEKEIADLAQFFIDKFNESIRAADSKTETDVLLQTLEIQRKLELIQQQ
jgi:hypothetical protein